MHSSGINSTSNGSKMYVVSGIPDMVGYSFIKHKPEYCTVMEILFVNLSCLTMKIRAAQDKAKASRKFMYLFSHIKIKLKLCGISLWSG